MPDLTGKDIGRYHVIEPIGQGGMAEVFKALDTTLEREVALKVIRAEEFGSAVLARIQQRFEREAKTLAKLKHPNIVPILDFGEFEGAPYLVMPYFDGGTLKERLGRPYDEGEAARLLLPLAEALAYAHQKGVLHRDIKPANILLTEGGQPMLTDFGIAKLLEGGGGQTLTGTGVGIGTPEYMAPEQGMGKEVDARADVYALGVVLYELVTGQKPYSADTPMAVVFKHMSDPLPRPRELNPKVSEACEQILFKALAKQPEHRYADMEPLRAALGKLAVGEKPTPAAPLAMDMPAEERTAELNAGLTVDLGTSLRPLEAPHVDEPAPETENLAPEVSEAPTPIPPSLPEYPKPNRKLWVWVGLAGVTIVGIIMTILLSRGGSLMPAPTETTTSTASPQPTKTAMVSPQPTPTLDPNIPPTCTEVGKRWVNPKDGGEMVCVPAGEFWLGAADGDNQAFDDEKPAQVVYLGAYWIDLYEVTNSQFARFIQSTGHSTDAENQGWSYIHNGTDYKIGNEANWYAPKGPGSDTTQKQEHPVIHVSWHDASEYCSWAGEKLPTEAQWEKAARGTDARLYPWGNQAPSSSLANFNQNINDTTEVGNFPNGASPYGAEDMAGNVWEWVADWYSERGYQDYQSVDPIGPLSGGARRIRGGSWGDSDMFLRVSYRNAADPSFTFDDTGFRCAYVP